MSEEEWDDGIDAPPQKRGIPGWLWFCGGGCLLVIVLGIGLLVWGAKLVKEGMDIPAQWEKVSHVLPYDQRPPHLQMQMGWHLFVTVYVLQDDRGYALLIYDLDASKAEGFRDVFTADFQGGGGTFGFGGVKNPQLSQLEIQGRTVPVQRFYQEGGMETDQDGPQAGTGHSAFVDVTPADHPGMVPVMIVRSRAGDQPLNDDEIRDVLSGFRIGPDHVPPPPPLPEQPAEQPLEEGGAAEDGR